MSKEVKDKSLEKHALDLELTQLIDTKASLKLQFDQEQQFHKGQLKQVNKTISDGGWCVGVIVSVQCAW